MHAGQAEDNKDFDRESCNATLVELTQTNVEVSKISTPQRLMSAALWYGDADKKKGGTLVVLELLVPHHRLLLFLRNEGEVISLVLCEPMFKTYP